MPSLRARIQTTINIPTGFGDVPVSMSLLISWQNFNDFASRLKLEGVHKGRFNKGIRQLMRARAETVRDHVRDNLGIGQAPLSPATNAIYAARRRLRTRGYRNLDNTGLGRSGVDRGFTGPGSNRPLVRSGRLRSAIVVRDRSRPGISRYEMEIGPTPTAKHRSGILIRDLIRILQTGYDINIPAQTGVYSERPPDSLHPQTRFFRALVGALRTDIPVDLGVAQRIRMPARQVLALPPPNSAAARRLRAQTRFLLEQLFRAMNLPVSVFTGGR